jgi:thiol-disulfide isomerase/thioredoxin
VGRIDRVERESALRLSGDRNHGAVSIVQPSESELWRRLVMRSFLSACLIAALLSASGASAADLVRGVRFKLSAGDLASGDAAVSDYVRANGEDTEYWNAMGWLARGAVMLGRPDLADRYVRKLRAGIPGEREELLIPFGARIEVEAKLLVAREGRGSALTFLHDELGTASDPALRSRINKNINLLSLEGAEAPPIDPSDFIGVKGRALEEMKGETVLLFLFAQWCGDCKAQAESLARVWQRYRDRGVNVVALTRYYGSVDGEDASPAKEKEAVARVWRESYPGLGDVPVTIDSDAMIRYGASATPTFVLIDREGVVRMYAPTRLSEEELTRRIDEVLGS